ncbi:MAG: DMT family transporter [Lautropia sp.]
MPADSTASTEPAPPGGPPGRLSVPVVVQLIALTLLWGVNWPIMKIGLADLAPMTFRTLTMVGGLLTLALLARYRGASLVIPRRYWREAVELALTNAIVWYTLSIVGVHLLASGRAAILGYTLPVWVALIGAVVYRERLGVRVLAGVAFAAVGVALLLANELGSIAGRPLGAVSMLLAAAVWGYGTHLMRRRKQPTSLIVLSFWMVLGGMVVCGVLALLFESDRPLVWPSAAGWFSIIYNAVLAYGVAQILWFRLATVLPPVVSALSVMLIPVVGVASGVVLLGERVVWTDVVALVAILAAIAATLLPARR